MHRVIPCFYGEYGKYLTRLRQIPYFVDGLTPVNRRLLLSLYDQARDKLTKSSKIIGYAISNYHPHGDASCYDTLQNLVINEVASSEQGNWGGRSLHGPDKPAAMRYTETRLLKWVKELAFQYYEYAPWENIEYEDEPKFLPSPVPIGLIGYDLTTGIAFHRVTNPRYTIKDLSIRLEWLLRNGRVSNQIIDEIPEEKLEETLGPEIKPNFRDCVSKPNEKGSYHRILLHGEGSLKVIPNGGIGTNNSIYIKGQVPETSFKKLKNLSDPSNKSRKYDIEIVDHSGSDGDFYSLLLQITPTKKNTNLKQLFKDIWSNCLIGNINFRCFFSDDEGKAIREGIDNILLRNYECWRDCVLKQKVDIFEKLNKKKFELNTISVIREIYNKNNKIKRTEDIINNFQKNYTNYQVELESYNFDYDKFESYKKPITSEDISRTCKGKTISQLIEVEVDFQEVENRIQEAKNQVLNNDQDCYNHIVELTK